MDEQRLNKLEAAQGVIETNFSTMTAVLNRVVDKLDVLSSHVATVMSSQGNVSTKTLLSFGAMCISTMALAVSIIVVIGRMSQQPIIARLDRAEAIQQERNRDWEQFQYWKGRMDERTELHSQLLSNQHQITKFESLPKGLEGSDGQFH